MQRLCPGSGRESASTYAFQTSMLCPECDAWVERTLKGPLVPLHDVPFTAEESARHQRNAAAIIAFEYRQARRNGTLISDPNRTHTTALGMARPRVYILANGKVVR